MQCTCILLMALCMYRYKYPLYMYIIPSTTTPMQDVSQYRFGKTKLFFRAGQVAYLERLRSQRLHEASVCVQSHVRGWVWRKRYREFRRATVRVQARVRGMLARR